MNNRKKIFLMILIVFLTVISSCSQLKNVFKKETKKSSIESTIKENDSTSLKTVNGAIEDNFSLKIPKSFSNDSIVDLKVNKRVNEILSGIDISKSSGENSYRVWWDSKQKRIRVYVNVAETVNEKTDTNKREEKNKTYIEIIKEEWKKTVLPWWIWLIPIFFFRKDIFSLLGFFIPGLKTATTISDIIALRKRSKL